MCRGERRQYIVQNLAHVVLQQRSTHYLVGQRASGQPLHHDEWSACVLAGVVHRDDVRVVQPSGGSCLGLKAPAIIGLHAECRMQQLDRDGRSNRVSQPSRTSAIPPRPRIPRNS